MYGDVGSFTGWSGAAIGTAAEDIRRSLAALRSQSSQYELDIEAMWPLYKSLIIDKHFCSPDSSDVDTTADTDSSDIGTTADTDTSDNSSSSTDSISSRQVVDTYCCTRNSKGDLCWSLAT